VEVHHDAIRFREFLPASTPVVLTIGTFDGVHAGHRAVLELLKKRAAQAGAETVLLTFDPHPRMVLHPESHGLALLNTLEEKEALLSQTGLHHLVIQPFHSDLARMTPLEYIRQLIGEGIQPKVVVVGYDHRFGRNREGDFAILTELGALFGFEVEELPAQHVDDTRVSSTKVRQALMAGDIADANHWLQSPYALTGRVVHGDQIGRTLGFPTANLGGIDALKLIPGNGVYLAQASFAGTDVSHPALVNVGSRPTISRANGAGEPRVEAHLLGFQGDCYGQTLTLAFTERIRDERKFPNRAALLEAMQADLAWAEQRIFDRATQQLPKT